MKLLKNNVIEYVEKLKLVSNYKIDSLVTELLTQVWCCEFEVADIFENEKLNLLSILNTYIKDFSDSNLIQKFEMKADKYLIWILSDSCNILDVEQKKRYSHREDLYQKIISDLDPLIFERFCSFILSELYEFEISNTTQWSKDGWIDFYWKYRIQTKWDVNFFKNHAIFIYGQAKKYTHPIQEAEIKEFSWIRKSIIEWKDDRVKNKLPKEFTENPSLSMLFFMTTSSFTKWAKHVADIHKIMLKDLNMVVDDLILKWNDQIFKINGNHYDISLSFL